MSHSSTESVSTELSIQNLITMTNTGFIENRACFARAFGVDNTETLLVILDAMATTPSHEKLLNILVSILPEYPVRGARGPVESVYGNILHVSVKSRPLASGSYGEIRACTYNGKRAVFKSPKENTALYRNFIFEAIVQTVIHCLTDPLIRCAVGKNLGPDLQDIRGGIVPEILTFGLATDAAGLDDPYPFIVMEHVGMNAGAWFDRGNTYRQELEFIAQIAQKMHLLQAAFGGQFIHGDFHVGNVMTSTALGEYEIPITPTRRIKITNSQNIKFIDFGFAAFHVGTCAAWLNMPDTTFKNAQARTNLTKLDRNDAYDMRMFLASLYYHPSKISRQLKALLARLFDPYRVAHWHEFYDMLYVDDPEFTPRRLLKLCEVELRGI